MTLTPRMVVAVILMASTIFVLLLSILGAQYLANQYAARNNQPTATAEPTSSPTVAPPSDSSILDIYKDNFSSARLAGGGADPVLFVTIDTDDASANAAIVNKALDETKALGGINSITLLFTYGDENYNASQLVDLVDSSEAIENQLIIKLG